MLMMKCDRCETTIDLDNIKNYGSSIDGLVKSIMTKGWTFPVKFIDENGIGRKRAVCPKCSTAIMAG